MFYRGGGFMQVTTKISNNWKTLKTIYINTSSSWKSCKNIYINISGTWKPIWSYSWKTGNWGNCTQTCGGGTQSRSVYCYRADGFTVNDSLCSGTKPNSSQICNNQSCKECKYDKSNYNWNYEGYTNSCWVYWGGSLIGSNFGDSGTTSYIYGGYMYTRGEYKDSGTYGSKIYQVCREQI